MPSTYILTLAQPGTGELQHIEIDDDGSFVDGSGRRFNAALVAALMADDELAICESAELVGDWLTKVAAHLGPVTAGAIFALAIHANTP